MSCAHLLQWCKFGVFLSGINERYSPNISVVELNLHNTCDIHTTFFQGKKETNFFVVVPLVDSRLSLSVLALWYCLNLIAIK